MKQKVTFARNDLADLVDFLATLHIKENASSYRLNNYLQQRNLCGMTECFQIEFTASWFEQKNRHHNNWKLSASGRMQVGQWLYRMTSSFGFPSEFAMISMNYFDRVLSCSTSLLNSKSEIQLLAVTCFYLAVKLFQTGPILSTEQISMISGFVFKPEDIVNMEQKILRELKWCLYPPIASEHLSPYLQILLCNTRIPLSLYSVDILNLANELVKEMVLDYFFVALEIPSSHIAIAALVNAMLTILPVSSELVTIRETTRVLSLFLGYGFDDSKIYLCCEHLWGWMNKPCHQHLNEALSASSNPSIIQCDYRAGSPTTNSPIGVASLTILNCDEMNRSKRQHKDPNNDLFVALE